MFPTFDVPPQHAETVGARKARKAKEEETARRSSSATSLSSGSIHSAKANSIHSKGTEKNNGFGWFGKNKKGIQEISSLPSIKKSPPPLPQDPVLDIGPVPPTAPLPPPPGQDLHRITSNRSEPSTYPLRPEHFPPPPLSALPSLPPSGALPRPPTSPRLNLPGTYCVLNLAFVICNNVAAIIIGPKVGQTISSDRRCPCT
jgi:hypothetical protein